MIFYAILCLKFVKVEAIFEAEAFLRLLVKRVYFHVMESQAGQGVHAFL